VFRVDKDAHCGEHPPVVEKNLLEPHLSIMIRLSLLTVLLLLCLSSGVFANVVDRSVAIVNEDTITLSEVNELGELFFKKITAETPANKLEATLQQARRTVIDKLIEQKILLQEAKKLNVQVSDQEVETALQRVIADNKATMEQFRKEMRAMGTTEKQYWEELREQILTSKLINHEIRAKVAVSDQAVREYYNDHYTSSTGGAYEILQIGCIWGVAGRNGVVSSQEETQEKAQKVRSLAMSGKDFKELAKQYSDLPTATAGGDLGSFQVHEMATYMSNAVINLKPGELSQIVEHDNGYHFFKLVSLQAGTVVAKESYEAVQEQIRGKLYQQAMEQRFQVWMKSNREKAYIKIL
jgi:peptidyl-prolyl cis-trans isomerase SurA